MRKLTASLLSLLPVLAACAGNKDKSDPAPQAQAIAVPDRSDELTRENSRLTGENARLRTQLTDAERELLKARRERMPAPPPPTTTNLKGHQDVEVEDRADRTIVRVPADLTFRSGQHSLTGDGQKVIEDIASLIKKSHPAGAIRVEGHADADPIKKSVNHCNTELAFKRAHTVMHALVEKGVPAARVAVASHGEHDPRDPNNKAKNRRVEIVILKQ